MANHYKVEVSSTIRKADLRKAISQYLVDEEIVSDEEYEPETDIELKKLELKERERERESQMRIKELEIKRARTIDPIESERIRSRQNCDK